MTQFKVELNFAEFLLGGAADDDGNDNDDQQLQAALLDKSGNLTDDDSIYIIVKSNIRKEGGLYAVQAKADTSIGYIKADVLVKTGIPLQIQRLVFAGKQLNDDYLFRDYGIRTGSILHMCDALEGGMPKKGTKKTICKMERLAVMRARVTHQSTLIQDPSNMAMLNNLASPEFSTQTIGHMNDLQVVMQLKTVADSVTRGDQLAKAIMPSIFPQINLMKQQRDELDRTIKGAEQAFELGFSEKFCSDAGFEVQPFYDMFENRITALQNHAAQQAA